MQNIFLHFCSDFEFLIKINDLTLGLIENKYDTLSCELNNESNLLVYAFPVQSFKPSIPFLAKLFIKNGKISSNSTNIEITNFDDKHFEAKIIPIFVNETKKPKIENKVFLDEIEICFFDDGKQNIEITKNNNIFKFELFQKIYEPKCNYFKQNGTDFITILGKTYKNEQFLIVFSNFFCNLEVVADVIEIKQNEITALKKVNDIAKHGIVQKFVLEKNEYKLVDEYIVFLDKKPKLVTNEKLVAWAFVEAINIQNFKLARSYLSFELSSSLSDENLLNFFGDYEEIVWNRYDFQEDVVCFLYKGNPKTIKKFKFEIYENKISNIYDLD